MRLPGLPPLFHAPHRVMFFAGATQGLLAMLWWAFDLAARYGQFYAAPAWPLPPPWIHAALMSFGFFPFFIFAGYRFSSCRCSRRCATAWCRSSPAR